MYVYSDSHTVWNHHDKVAIVVAKDFKILHNYEECVEDVIVMCGLCGGFNTITRTSNMLLEVTSSNDVSVYGILSYKKPTRKAKKKSIIRKIHPNNYTVYSYLRKTNSWYWESGYNTCNSDKTRAAINKTKNGTNYHKTAPVT